MTAALLAFLLGAAASLATSWLLVSRLERLGELFGLSEGALGLVAALAADSPEITAAVTALAHHERAVGAGVVLGSNVFNLAALLGLAAVMAGRVALHRRVVALGGAVGVWIALVCVLSVVGAVPAWVGLLLAGAVLAGYAYVLGAGATRLEAGLMPRRWARWLSRAVAEEEMELVQVIRPRRGTGADAVVAGACLVAVVAASTAMERSASSLGHRWHVAGIVVGGLVLAAVTSLPNAVAGAYLAARGRGAALFSTALNSNALNVVFGLLVPSAITGLARPSLSGNLVALWYAGLSAATIVLAWRGRGLARGAGLAIILSYGAFVGALVAVAP